MTGGYETKLLLEPAGRRTYNEGHSVLDIEVDGVCEEKGQEILLGWGII